MEYRAKAAVIIAFIFFFLLATVTAVYFGVKISADNKTDNTYDGGVMVNHIIETEKDLI